MYGLEEWEDGSKILIHPYACVKIIYRNLYIYSYNYKGLQYCILLYIVL